MPGCAISIPGHDYGTFGCIVREQSAEGAPLLLSSTHVIGNHSIDPLGLPVLQPGRPSGPASTLLGSVVRWTALRPTPNDFPNRFEVALARLLGGVATPVIPGIGAPRGARRNVPVGTALQFCGAKSGHTLGKVLEADVACAFTYRDATGNQVRVGFQQQLLCTKPEGSIMTQGGDSGAAVLDMDRRVVGVVIGSISAGTVVSPIGPILDAFGVTIDWEEE
jgi:hypothetical protein